MKNEKQRPPPGSEFPKILTENVLPIKTESYKLWEA